MPTRIKIDQTLQATKESDCADLNLKNEQDLGHAQEQYAFDNYIKNRHAIIVEDTASQSNAQYQQRLRAINEEDARAVAPYDIDSESFLGLLRSIPEPPNISNLGGIADFEKEAEELSASLDVLCQKPLDKRTIPLLEELFDRADKLEMKLESMLTSQNQPTERLQAVLQRVNELTSKTESIANSIER